jgi:selenocysteine-specific elongation factor
VPDAIAETGWQPAQVQRLAFELERSGGSLRFGDLLVASATAEKLRTQMLSEIEVFHKANPLVAGVSKEELRERLGLRPEILRGIVEGLVRERKLVVTGEIVHAAGRGVVMRDEEAESKRQIEQAFSRAGLKVPGLKEVLATLPVDKVRAQKLVTLLLRDHVLVKLADDLVFHRDALDELRKLVIAQKTKKSKLNVAEFKDLTGITRKYAIPLLEYLDRERITRRVGDERVIL